MGRYADQIKQITREQSRRRDGRAPTDEGDGAPGGEDTGGGRRGREAEGDDQGAGSRGPLIALVIVAVLAGLGWILVRQLMADSKLQDCVMSGRKNCAPVEIDSSGR